MSEQLVQTHIQLISDLFNEGLEKRKKLLQEKIELDAKCLLGIINNYYDLPDRSSIDIPIEPLPADDEHLILVNKDHTLIQMFEKYKLDINKSNTEVTFGGLVVKTIRVGSGAVVLSIKLES